MPTSTYLTCIKKPINIYILYMCMNIYVIATFYFHFKDICIMEAWTEGVFSQDIKLTGTGMDLSHICKQYLI